MDIVNRQTRSRMMASIGGRNTAPEMAVRRALHAARLRFRLHRRELPGKPDIVLARYGAVVFVHGCFWHRHRGCRFATTPQTNSSFWKAKFEVNAARDSRQRRALRSAGWRVYTMWECQVSATAALSRLIRQIRGEKYEAGNCEGSRSVVGESP